MAFRGQSHTSTSHFFPLALTRTCMIDDRESAQYCHIPYTHIALVTFITVRILGDKSFLLFIQYFLPASVMLTVSNGCPFTSLFCTNSLIKRLQCSALEGDEMSVYYSACSAEMAVHLSAVHHLKCTTAPFYNNHFCFCRCYLRFNTKREQFMMAAFCSRPVNTRGDVFGALW